MNTRQQSVFVTIVIAQFFGTSLWFAGNVILPQLQQSFGWGHDALGYLTSSTQVGFIAGTLTFAARGFSDKFSPSKLFFVSSVLACACNLIMLVDLSSYPLVITSRFLVGFFLAGIYPVGMKIASDWKAEGLGNWLGALVGALVLGTAFPYSMKLIPGFINPEILIITISILCLTGGFLVLVLVPDGPFRKKSASFSFSAVGKIFKAQSFRSPSFGYFGHMWELYAFWAFVPWIINHYLSSQPSGTNPSLWAFIIIGSGAVGCVAGGLLSNRFGSARVAFYALAASGLCCVISPFIWNLSLPIFMSVLIFWGITVAGDSPQLSALVARQAPEEYRGSAITFVLCIGFSITIVSIQILNFLQYAFPADYLLMLLAPGPLLGLIALRKSLKKL